MKTYGSKSKGGKANKANVSGHYAKNGTKYCFGKPGKTG